MRSPRFDRLVPVPALQDLGLSRNKVSRTRLSRRCSCRIQLRQLRARQPLKTWASPYPAHAPLPRQDRHHLPGHASLTEVRHQGRIVVNGWLTIDITIVGERRGIERFTRLELPFTSMPSITWTLPGQWRAKDCAEAWACALGFVVTWRRARCPAPEASGFCALSSASMTMIIAADLLLLRRQPSLQRALVLGAGPAAAADRHEA